MGPRTLLAFGSLLALVASVAAQPPLVTWKGCSDLGCMGQVKMRVSRATREDAAGTYNFLGFTNNEVLFEDLSTPSPRKILHLTQPDSTFLFFGVKDAQEAEAFRAKYQSRVAHVMILVLGLTAKGFPEGAGAMPAAWDTRRVEMDQMSFAVSARRITADSFAFRVLGPNHLVEGDWIMTKVAPWPNSQSMAGWMAGNGVAIPGMTLGELRQLRRR